jgi:hypothetical protein
LSAKSSSAGRPRSRRCRRRGYARTTRGGRKRRRSSFLVAPWVPRSAPRRRFRPLPSCGAKKTARAPPSVQSTSILILTWEAPAAQSRASCLRAGGDACATASIRGVAVNISRGSSPDGAAAVGLTERPPSRPSDAPSSPRQATPGRRP